MKRLIFALFLAACILVAEQFPTMTNSWVLKPVAIPTTPTDISTLVGGGKPPSGADISACYMDVSIAPNAQADITIQDGAGNVFFNAVPIPAPGAGLSPSQGQTYIVLKSPYPEACKIFWGGMIISASGTGATLSASGRF